MPGTPPSSLSDGPIGERKAHPDRLLEDALRASGGRPEVAIDSTRLEGLRGPDARLIADFVSEIL